MSEADLTAAAKRLRDAYRTGPIDPLSTWLGDVDAQAGYRIQAINTEHWLGEGRRAVGCKIGLTSVAVQRQLGVDQPDYGILYADTSYETGCELSAAHLLQPRAESELAFALERDLDATGVDLDDVVNAIAWVCPAIEVADSRVRDWKISLADTIADNASAGIFVLGNERRSAREMDLAACRMTQTCNAEVVSTGSGAACLGNPLNAVLWLARKMIEHGRPLREGDIILSGALGPMTAVAAGDRLHTDIAGVGSVQVSFV